MNDSKGGNAYAYMVPMGDLAQRNNQKPCVVTVRKAKKQPAKFVGA
ncbi:hypothetical protein NVP1052A_66 [Vibrio phage 1.052.A._10N.286.46.C3]|nr:hypothetical protein NVP1052A_66 [Vibrio phage 1.052.A._10N.286.46.C3]